MSLLINIYVQISACLLYLSINLICRTLRFKIRWKNEYDRAKEKSNVLFAVWHQATFVMFYLYRGRGACVFVTPEVRGRILEKCATWMGYQTITVPMKEGSFELGRSMAKMVRRIKQGQDAVIAVDGPAGPLHEVKPGADFLSAKAKIPIIPLAIKAPWRLTLFWRWDKYFIPLPFSQVRVRVGKPIWPDQQLNVNLKRKLKRLSQ